MNEQGSKERGKKEGRSPSYPAISLGTALERTRTIMEKEKRHYASLVTIFGHWGYGPKSSAGILLLAALKKYGLVEDKGSGDSREAKITDFAWRILVDDRPNSNERAALIREAALNPTIHQKLWRDYDGQLPSDENLKHRLRIEDGFTSGAVDDFIRQFRATIAFAKLEETDSLSAYEEDKLSTKEDQVMPPARDISQPDRTPSPPPSLTGENPKMGEQRFEVGLSQGQITYFKAPPSMTPEDWEKIRALLNVLAPLQKENEKN